MPKAYFLVQGWVGGSKMAVMGVRTLWMSPGWKFFKNLIKGAPYMRGYDEAEFSICKDKNEIKVLQILLYNGGP